MEAVRLITGLHHAGYQYMAAVTGGGALAAAMLLNVPGASKALLEVLVPYHPQSLSEFLGCEPEQSCSPATARLMAERALARAHTLTAGEHHAGIGCTASLATDRPKKGDHRFHLAIATDNGVTTWSLTLAKDRRDRPGEEAVLDAVLLNAMAEVFGVPARLDPGLLADEERLHVENFPADATLSRLYRGEAETICFTPDGRFTESAPPPTLVLSGSFNPLHHGHVGMGAAAERRTGRKIAYEISIDNVDKPSLIVEDVCRRVRQFLAHGLPVWLTRAPIFVRKAALFPGVTFVVGFDTAERIVDPKYYGGSAENLRQALASIRARNCRFLVAGRFDETRRRFLTLDDVPIPAEFVDLFEGMSESEFRDDISSTAERARITEARVTES